VKLQRLFKHNIIALVFICPIILGILVILICCVSYYPSIVSILNSHKANTQIVNSKNVVHNNNKLIKKIEIKEQQKHLVNEDKNLTDNINLIINKYPQASIQIVFKDLNKGKSIVNI